MLLPTWRRTDAPRVDVLFSLKVGGRGTRPGVRHYHLAYVNSTRVARTHDLSEAVAALERRLHEDVAIAEKGLFFVRGAALAVDGQGIVLPGPETPARGALLQALARRGVQCLSGTFAVLDRRGRVYPYPAPLLLPEGRIPVERPDSTRGLPLARVFCLDEGPLRPWSPAQATVALFDHRCTPLRDPRPWIDTLPEAVGRAETLAGGEEAFLESFERLALPA